MGWLLPSVACIHPPTRHSLGSFTVDRPLPLKTDNKGVLAQNASFRNSSPLIFYPSVGKIDYLFNSVAIPSLDWFSVHDAIHRIQFSVAFLKLQLVYEYSIYDFALLNTTLDFVSLRDMSLVTEGLTPYLTNIGPALVTMLCLVNNLKRSFIDDRFGWDIAHLRY